MATASAEIVPSDTKAISLMMSAVFSAENAPKRVMIGYCVYAAADTVANKAGPKPAATATSRIAG